MNERLLESKAKYELERLESGRAFGRNFAESEADYAELDRLAAFANDPDRDLEALMDEEMPSDVAQQLHDAMFPDDVGGYRQFWGAENACSISFIEGFVEACLFIHSELNRNC